MKGTRLLFRSLVGPSFTASSSKLNRAHPRKVIVSYLSNRSFSSLTTSYAGNAMDAPLPYRVLPFNSVEIDADMLPVNDTAEFGTRLWSTISHLRKEGKSAVYLKMSMLYSHYVPVAGLYGFKYHHAEGDEATMLLWLPTSTPNQVPPFATHHCGVAGALTINTGSETKILLVKEKSKQSAWKLPGGYVNLGEDFSAAAVREVFEETGVKSEFQSILTVRQSHDIQFGRGDVYMICRMKALSEAITVDEEIEDATWMSLKDFKTSNKHPMLDRVADLLLRDHPGLAEETMNSTIKGRLPFKLFYPQ